MCICKDGISLVEVLMPRRARITPGTVPVRGLRKPTDNHTLLASEAVQTKRYKCTAMGQEEVGPGKEVGYLDQYMCQHHVRAFSLGIYFEWWSFSPAPGRDVC